MIIANRRSVVWSMPFLVSLLLLIATIFRPTGMSPSLSLVASIGVLVVPACSIGSLVWLIVHFRRARKRVLFGAVAYGVVMGLINIFWGFVLFVLDLQRSM